jgi:hypothetical protein
MMLGLPAWSQAQGSTAAVKAELKTALFHAGELAQKASAMSAVQLHTQHTINCLEGPKGMQFKAAAGYPCQGQGNGIIPDLQAAVASGAPGAQTALKDATTALDLALQVQAQSDVAQAQPWLKVVARYLQEASDALGM